MRRIALLLLVSLVVAAAYIAVPFHTAWGIREAARTGDTAYLAAKIDWPSLKESLKPTIARMALNLPAEVEAAADGAPPPRLSLWQRTKAYLGQGVVNRVVEKYVTPEGLPQLFTYKKTYNSVRDTFTGAKDDTAELSLGERFKRFWARVERAEFKSLTRFEIDVRDKLMPERRFDGVLELRGLEWKLTELRVRDSAGAATGAPTATDATTAEFRSPTSAPAPATDFGPAETLPTDK